MNPDRSARLQALVLLLRHMRLRWYLYLPAFAVWGFAYLRLFVDPTPRVPLLFNWTPSLPCRVAWLVYGSHELKRGDYVVFAFDGEARTAYPGLQGQPFFKIVRGLPGDRVTVDGRVVSVNGEVVGTAKTHTFDRRLLEPITDTVIPPGHYYVQGTSPDSFDSRYHASGLVRAEQVLGTVVPLFQGRPMPRFLPLLPLLFIAIGVQAQPASSPAPGDIPMADYLGLLAQIAPAAREGTEAYLQAFERRCRRALTTAELRRAMSEGNGDPVLMGLIRASQLRDEKTVADLALRIDCGGRR